MHNIIIFTSIMLIVFSSVLSAGWERTYGGRYDDEGGSVVQTTDGGYIIIGYTRSFGSGWRDVYIIKTDSTGDTLWTRTYGGGNNDVGISIMQTTDGGYIITGDTESFGTGASDVYLIKIDAHGDTLWTRTHGGSDFDNGCSVMQTTDGGYIVAGITYSFDSTDYGDVYLIKTDAHGDTLWTHTYGGRYSDAGFSVAQATDGGYIIAGYTFSFGAGESDVYLIKTNAYGDTLWTRTYGGRHYDISYSVVQTADGGYIIAGMTCSFRDTLGDVYLIKTDSNGDTIWTQTYGGRYTDAGVSIAQTIDGGYIIAGVTGFFGDTLGDVYLIKTDSNGDTIWTRIFGGSDLDFGRSVAQTTDGGYIITGKTKSFSTSGWDLDVYLIKTDSLGHTGIKETSPHEPNTISFTVFPNPFNSSCKITAAVGAKIEVYSLIGNLLWRKTIPKSTPATLVWTPDENITSGIYLIRVTAGNKSATKRVIYLR